MVRARDRSPGPRGDGGASRISGPGWQVAGASWEEPGRIPPGGVMPLRSDGGMVAWTPRGMR